VDGGWGKWSSLWEKTLTVWVRLRKGVPCLWRGTQDSKGLESSKAPAIKENPTTKEKKCGGGGGAPGNPDDLGNVNTTAAGTGACYGRAGERGFQRLTELKPVFMSSPSINSPNERGGKAREKKKAEIDLHMKPGCRVEEPGNQENQRFNLKLKNGWYRSPRSRSGNPATPKKDCWGRESIWGFCF